MGAALIVGHMRNSVPEVGKAARRLLVFLPLVREERTLTSTLATLLQENVFELNYSATHA